jgi:hypothetical protein
MDSLPDQFWQGVAQFNQRQFYACHDTLEALWIEAGEPEKKFYQGILQIAVGLYHLSNHNWRGAVILMGEGMGRLSSYQPTFGEVDVEALLQQTTEVLTLLQTTGAEQVVETSQYLACSTNSGKGFTTGSSPIQLPTIDRLLVE